MIKSVSVQVCTLNEEKNIQACLEAILSNEPEHVLVIDGGSNDKTVEIVLSMGVPVIQAGRVGLAKQRRIGYLTSKSEYTAFVDADDRIENKWIEIMLIESQRGGYAALQSLLIVKNNGSWWSKGWNECFLAAIKTRSDSIIVGRPAIFLTSALHLLPEPLTQVASEDTEMSRQFEILGLRQGIGTAVSYRLCPETLSENWFKWRSYGRGYRQFVNQFPERRLAIAKHILFSIPISRTLPRLLRGRISQPLFGLMMTLNFIIGWFQEVQDSKSG